MSEGETKDIQQQSPISFVAQIEESFVTIGDQIEDTSREIYLHDARFFITWMLDNNLTPQTLSYEDMAKYRKHLLSRYANSTAARMFSVARRLLGEQVRKGYISHNPASGIRPIPTNDETTHVVLTKEESEALLNCINVSSLKGRRDHALLLLLLRLGIRRKECAELNVSDFGVEQGHNIVVIQHGKGDKRRVNKVPVDVKRVIDEYVQTRQERGIVTDALFTHVTKGDIPNTSRISVKQIYRIVRSYGKLAGIQKLSPHGLRGTFITLSLEADAPLTKVQYAVGHSDPRTTERYQTRKLNLDDNAVDFVKVRRKGH